MFKLLLILFISLSFSVEAIAKFRKCLYGGYTFVGNEYSDSLTLKQVNNLDACKDPLLNKNAQQINQDYLINHEQIKKMAESLLADTKCISVKNIVKKFLEMSKEIEEKISKNSVDRYDTFELIKQQKEFEMQSHFIYGGLYNAACSNEDNRTFSMFDLEIINQLLALKADPPAVKVTSTNKDIEDCSNVVASGSDDLENFTVSMKNGTQNFIFSFDPFGIPDQVIVSNQNNKILYDSGCKANDKIQPPMKLTLDAPQNSKVTIKVINNCKDRSNRGNSQWNLTLKCQIKTEKNICKKQLDELAELLKKEVEILKDILDHYELERQCFIAYGEKIWEKLLNFGFIEEDNRAVTMGLCPILDIECEERLKEQRQLDLFNLQPKTQTPKVQPPKEEMPVKKLECPKKPDEDASIFKMISWSYCKVGLKKLGL